MRRKTSSLPTVIYTYGVHEPENYQVLVDQMYLANKYQNRLVEIELKRRTAEAKLLSGETMVSELEAAVEATSAKVDAAYAAIKQKRQKSRTSKVDDKHEKAEIKQLKDELKLLYPKLKQAKAEARERLEGDRARLWQAFYDECKAARKDCGVYWGTYLQVENAFEAARKSPNPRFHRFDGSGMLAVQIQKDASMKNIFQMQDIPPEVWHLPRGERRRASLIDVKMRVGSDEKRKPLWAEFKIRQHRPLPKDSVIKWVKLLRYRVGPVFRWELQLSVEHARPATSHSNLKNAAIHLGWRRLEDGRLRVGYLYDYLGEDREVLFNERNLSALRHADSLVAIREREFNQFAPWITTWLEQNVEIIPDWLKEATDTISQWKSPRRLSRVAFKWRDSRFPGDEEAFERLNAWRKQDKHLWDWEANERDKTIRRRRDEYRVIAARLASEYDVIYIDDVNLQDILTKDKAEDSAGANIRYVASAAAIGEFRSILKNACESRGCRLERVSADNITKTCFACKHVNDFSDTKDLIQICNSCGVSWDQDANAARNTRARGVAGELVSIQQAAA